MAGKEAWIALGVTVAICAAVVGAFMAGMRVPKGHTAPETNAPAHGKPASDSPKVETAHVDSSGQSEAFDQAWAELISDLAKRGMKPVVELSGDGAVQTQYFTVSEPDQYLVWGLDPDTKFRMLTISAKSNRSAGDIIAPNATKEWNGASWVHLEPGSYYLDVMASGKWKVNVYQK